MNIFPRIYSEGLRNFINYLLVIDPKKRPSFYQIGKFEIFNDENYLCQENNCILCSTMKFLKLVIIKSY